MMKTMDIIIPREFVSDDQYLLQKLCVVNNDFVKEGEILALIESSKSVIDVTSPADGYVYFFSDEGDIVSVGERLALLASTKEALQVEIGNSNKNSQRRKESETKSEDVSLSGVRCSKKALLLMKQHNIDVGAFDGLGMVTAQDVEHYLSSREKAVKATVAPSSVNRQKIIILGGGGHSKVCIDILRQAQSFTIAGILDSIQDIGAEVLGIPVIGRDTMPELLKTRESGISLAVNGIGLIPDHRNRCKLFERLLEAGFHLPNLIHPKASIEPSAKLGEGNQIMAGAIIGSDVTVGNYCLINSGVVVSHDCIIDDHVHLAPGALLAGAVRVGRNSLIGMGVTIYAKVTIGSNVVIANGANVFHDVPDNTVVKI